MVNQAHIYPDGTIGDHIHAQVYHEGVAKKGASNVASLMWKTLNLKGLIKENDICGRELNSVFDNCTG